MLRAVNINPALPSSWNLLEGLYRMTGDDANAATAAAHVATLKRLIRKATIAGTFFPVLCGSAFKNKGVQPLLDAVVDFLPSPADVPPVKGVDLKGN